MAKRLVTPNIERLTPYSPGKPIEEVEREIGITGVIKLASNENPLGPSPRAREAIAAYLGRLHRYPDGGSYYLKEALAGTLGVGPERLVVGNGSNDVIELFARTFLGPGEHAVMSRTAFIIYKLICQALDRPFDEVPMAPGFCTDLDAMAAAVRPETKIVFLANPNNPTGTYVGRDELCRFASRLPPDVLLVLDEAYRDYATADDYPDGMEVLAWHPRTIVCRTFSKIYGLAGLRCGFAVADRDLAEYVNRVRQPFNCSAVAQVAARAALEDREFVELSRSVNTEGMRYLRQALPALGLEVVPSQANFVLVRLPVPGRWVFEALLRRGVIVRPMDSPYGLLDCIRVTVGSSPENRRLVETLAEVLTEAGHAPGRTPASENGPPTQERGVGGGEERRP